MPFSSQSFFQQGGGLSDTLSHFELRQGQVELVQAIEETIDDGQHLVAEAGTGIGKTFAYLLPTLAKGKQVFVSTATKHLQDQIFFKDLPIIEKVLGRSVSACLLKGRSNYFCRYRYESFFSSQLALNKQQQIKANRVKAWSEETLSGDLSEIATFADADIGFKKRITSTTDNCLGGECPYFDQCFVQKVREKARKSEVVIINHALLMADIVLKETGFAEILPSADVVVIDEAHHLPKIATQAFAEEVTGRQISELARDALQVYHQDAGDVEGFVEGVDAILAKVADFFDALQSAQSVGQIQLSELKSYSEPYEQFKQLMKVYQPFLQALSELASRSNDLAQIDERARLMAKRIKGVFSPVPAQELVVSAQDNVVAGQSVALLEWHGDDFRAARLPIYLGQRFSDVMQSNADSWIFVSATLSVDGDFDFFLSSMGFPADMRTLAVESPFDYQRHAVIHIAEDLPAPNSPHFVNALVDFSLPLIKQLNGRTFMLFTSYRHLNIAADLLQDSDFDILVQGDLPKSQLIDAFIQSNKGVLLGTVSFWEGVDVAGDNLSCVIIDKIPFPSPGDPIIAEQARYLAQQGKNAFAHCYIPQAATLLKQGAGRLIRSASDKGALIFGDHRMQRKAYGQQLINSMPPARQVDYQALVAFIEDEL